MNTITMELNADYCTPEDVAFACKLARQTRGKVMLVKRLRQPVAATSDRAAVPMQPMPMLVGVVQLNPESHDAEVIYVRRAHSLPARSASLLNAAAY